MSPRSPLPVVATCTALVLLFTAALPGGGGLGSRAWGDVFHLERGGTLQGKLLGEDAGFYRVRTAGGVVSLARAAVTRIEPGPVPFEEYDARAAATPDTADGHFALAEWCGEQGLRSEAHRHLLRAIELDVNHAGARRALGYVRVGGLWVEGRTPATRREIEPEPADEAERLVRAVQGEWQRRIQLIRRDWLESGKADRVEAGRQRILEIRDPLAIGPLAEVLSRSRDVATRRLLVEALAALPDEEATLNLAIMGLVEPDRAVREMAVAALTHRDDPQVAIQYRRALHVPSEALVKRAAYGLGEIKARGAVPELIALLTDQRDKWVEVPIRDYFEVWPRAYYRDAVGIPIGGIQVSHRRPSVGVYIYADQTINEWQVRNVTVYRTEVREALRRITGQDFGFDRVAWEQWLYSQPQP